MITGKQEPRIRIEPSWITSDGTGAAKLMKAYSQPLDEWQKMVLNAWLATDDAGDYMVTSAGLSCPRQNGKNYIIEAREIYGLLVNGERILHTANQMRTTREAFRRLVTFFTNDAHPEIKAQVKGIRYANGEQAITLNNGGMIEFAARSRQSARGVSGCSLIVFDEAQELQEEEIEAIVAVLSASATGQRQIIYAGTPPYPGAPGDVFRRFRESCIKAHGEGNVSTVSWHEWSCPGDGIAEIDLDSRELWYACNPALGKRLTIEFTEEERRTLEPSGFLRERLGFWAKPTTEKADELAIDLQLWESCRSNLQKPEGKTAYGVKFSVDGSEVCLCGAVIGNDGIARIEVIERRPAGYGLQWLADWLNARYKVAACVVIDGRNGADLLIDKIASVWVFKSSVIRPRAHDVIMAHDMLLDELREHTVTWYAQQESLHESAITTVKRRIGQGWGFGGSGSPPIEACSLALWGARTSKRNPGKKMKIG